MMKLWPCRRGHFFVQLAELCLSICRFDLPHRSERGRGDWRELTLAPGFTSLNAFGTERIHAVGGSIYVFKGSGEAARLTFDTCASP